ncbi:outer membrane protein assembly factor BamE [Aggregatibacter segnis]|jgi:plp4|uniref:OmpA family protein n=1 Tax=Aggregatibacter segnis TaxID=739 RepID=UPI000DADB9FE|nr:OmpA family protein [Aggregatibacter segnis]RDE66269.1 outer membrane protein assembly factor BamE [Aggregatibacter segnis]
MTLAKMLLSTIAATMLVACGNLSQVSKEGAPADNTELVWPKIEDSKFNHDGSQFGSWPNWDNVRMIEKGMNKDQLYNLIGRPHFAEGLFAVREWDYVFHYRENGEHKVCQYKVLFDSDMNAQNFYWYPNGCNSNFSFSLAGDFLFDFDKDTLTARGVEVIDNIAQQLKSAHAKDVKIDGYTDRLGSDRYNLALSQRRADRVKARLIELGLNARIVAIGHGKANQVKACDGSGQALKDCLAPNRRVEISSSGSLVKAEDTKSMGRTGPAPLYAK